MLKNGQRLRILVAEDDALLATTVDDFLTHAGFSVSVSPDGLDALEVAANGRFDVLLTDLRMPRLDGVALIRGLRATRPELPVVVMTGYAPSDWRTSLQRQGEGPLILLDKPIQLRGLLRALREVLGSRS